MKQTQSCFSKQAWKSPEIHGKTAPEAIYKEMQRRTKDKAEEENLVQKNALQVLYFQTVRGRVYQQMPHKVINSNYCKRNHYVKASGKQRKKVLLILH